MYGEDPTANELEAVAARLLGKEPAVLMPSGVMANQIALSVLAGPEQLVAVGSLSHIHVFEGDLPQRRLMPLDDTDDGRFIELAWSARHTVAAVAVENTHMAREGHVMSPALLASLAQGGMPIHLDGARLMNAAAALDVRPEEIAAHATTVMLTLSKGLGAPIGSVLAGPDDVIKRARRLRLALGGGLAQAGIVAAAGLVALPSPPGAFSRRSPPGRAASGGRLDVRDARARDDVVEHQLRGGLDDAFTGLPAGLGQSATPSRSAACTTPWPPPKASRSPSASTSLPTRRTPDGCP